MIRAQGSWRGVGRQLEGSEGERALVVRRLSNLAAPPPPHRHHRPSRRLLDGRAAAGAPARAGGAGAVGPGHPTVPAAVRRHDQSGAGAYPTHPYCRTAALITLHRRGRVWGQRMGCGFEGRAGFPRLTRPSPSLPSLPPPPLPTPRRKPRARAGPHRAAGAGRRRVVGLCGVAAGRAAAGVLRGGRRAGALHPRRRRRHQPADVHPVLSLLAQEDGEEEQEDEHVGEDDQPHGAGGGARA